MNSFFTYGGDQVDTNDLMHAVERFGQPIAAIPAPRGTDANPEDINPHVTRLVYENGVMRDIFHVKPVYYRHVEGGWRPMSEIASHYGNHLIVLKEDWSDRLELAYLAWLLKRMELIGGRIEIPSFVQTPTLIPFIKRRERALLPLSETPRAGHATIHFSTLTAYPDPNVETVTVDGVSCASVGYGNWSGVRSASSGNYMTDDSSASTWFWSAEYDSGYNRSAIGRSFFLFNTATLGATATVSASVMSCYHNTTDRVINGTDANSFTVLVSSSPASNTAVSASDYPNVGSTEYSDERTDQYDTGGATGYKDFTCNASGISAVSKTGVTKFGVRTGHDLNNSAPNGTSYSGGADHTCIYYADASGTSTDPKLVVTYSVALNATVTPGVIAGTLSILAPALSAAATVLPSIISGTFSVLAPTVSAVRNQTITPAILTGTLSILAPSVSATKTATVTPSVLTGTFSIFAPTKSAGATATPATLTGTLSVLAPTIVIDDSVHITPSVLTGTFSILTPTVSAVRNVTLTPSVLSGTLSVLSPSVSATSNVTLATLTGVFTVYSPSVSASASKTVSVVTGTFSVLAPSVSAEINATTSIGIIVGTFSVLSPIVSAVRHATASPATIEAVLSLLSLELVRGDFWQEKYHVGTRDMWSDKY